MGDIDSWDPLYSMASCTKIGHYVNYILIAPFVYHIKPYHTISNDLLKFSLQGNMVYDDIENKVSGNVFTANKWTFS